MLLFFRGFPLNLFKLVGTVSIRETTSENVFFKEQNDHRIANGEDNVNDRVSSIVNEIRCPP